MKIDRETILKWTLSEGFPSAKICRPGFYNRDNPFRQFPELSVVMVALPYEVDETEDLSSPEEPHGLIAPFARRNYYREVVNRLKKIALRIRENTSLKKKDIRIFCNSQLPEKELAALSGLGFLGKNSLIITPQTGSLCVIGGIAFSLPLEPDVIDESFLIPGHHCGKCRACIDACPTNAILAPGRIDAQRCIQSLSTMLKPLPEYIMEKWGFRIYGCQSCQKVCPFNSCNLPGADTSLGVLGPSIPLQFFLASEEKVIETFFKGSTMGMSWIPPLALKRNAIIAAGNRRDESLLPLLRPFLNSEISFLKGTAKWAINKISLTPSI